MPKDSYTLLVEKMFDVPNVTVHLNKVFDRAHKNDFDHVFFTGLFDAWFKYSYGRLPCRTLDFETFRDEGDDQGTEVVNYCEQEVPHTRIAEHKHFAPRERHEKTICYKE